MAFNMKVLISVSFLYQLFLIVNAGTISSVNSGRYPRRLQTKGYLPPYPTPNFGDKTHIQHHNTEAFFNNNQLSHKKSNIQQSKNFNSYGPPPSGQTAFQYTGPQTNNKFILPSLIPKSVLEQLSTSDDNQQEQTNDAVLMVEEPASLLTSSQNNTIEAAKLLASTLLEANGEPPLEDFSGAQEIESGSLHDGKQLNNTDVVIVKSQKNAYIIPTHLAKDTRSSTDVQELYQMRAQLEKAYTINQFIFIIKPEKINFLNKLV